MSRFRDDVAALIAQRKFLAARVAAAAREGHPMPVEGIRTTEADRQYGDLPEAWTRPGDNRVPFPNPESLYAGLPVILAPWRDHPGMFAVDELELDTRYEDIAQRPRADVTSVTGGTEYYVGQRLAAEHAAELITLDTDRAKTVDTAQARMLALRDADSVSWLNWCEVHALIYVLVKARAW